MKHQPVTRHCVRRYFERVLGLNQTQVSEAMAIPARVAATRVIIRSKVSRGTRFVDVAEGLRCESDGIVFCVARSGVIVTCFQPDELQKSKIAKLLAA